MIASTREVRAAYVERLGAAADEIRVGSLPAPKPVGGEVPVEVIATAVNRVDTFIRSGVYRTEVQLPFVVGRDLVGTVVERDSEAGLERGDRVWCNSLGYDGRQGAAAERVVVPPERLYRLPDRIAPEFAVSLLHPVSTAHLAVGLHGEVCANDTVLITGAAGNVGSAAVFLARSVGARVIALCRASDGTYCRSLGATATIDYRDPKCFERLEAVAPSGINLVVDAAGVNDLPPLLELLSLRGRIVLLAGAADRPALPVGQLYMQDRSVRGFAISNASLGELAEASRVVNSVLIGQAYRPRRVEVYPLEEMREVHDRVERHGQHGTRFVVRLRSGSKSSSEGDQQ